MRILMTNTHADFEAVLIEFLAISTLKPGKQLVARLAEKKPAKRPWYHRLLISHSHFTPARKRPSCHTVSSLLNTRG
jgi:hypothetical protein